MENDFITVGRIQVRENDLTSPLRTTMTMLCTAKEFGINLFLFFLEDYDANTDEINGQFMENGEIVRRVIKLSDVDIIDNSAEGRARRVCKIFEDKVIFTQNYFTYTKEQTQRVLSEKPEFADLLIPLEQVKTKEEVLLFLHANGGVCIMKPNVGSNAVGVVKIEHNGETYLVSDKTREKEVYNEEGLGTYLDSVFAERPQVCQAFSQSITHDNRPFSIRLENRRGEGGKWNTNIIPVIGKRDDFLANPGAGGGAGYVCLINNFLRGQYGLADANKIRRELKDIGVQLTDYLQERQKNRIAGCFGYDFGISTSDNGYRYSLYEVNYHPGIGINPALNLTQAFILFGYYKWLVSNKAGDTAE